MSLAVFPNPPLSPAERALRVDKVKVNHLTWLSHYILEEELRPIKATLDECYALLAPVHPGSTLVMSTPRNERVKGTITRVGTRIVKANVNLQLQTQTPTTISLRPNAALHIPQLATLTHHLNDAITLTTATLSLPPTPPLLKAQLRALSDLVTDATAILKGPPRDPETDTLWTTQSCAAEHFDRSSLPGRNVSWYFALQDAMVVLYIRVLEPVDAPMHFGTRFGLAIGTVRRLEHDESGLVFDYVYNLDEPMDTKARPPHPPRSKDDPSSHQVGGQDTRASTSSHGSSHRSAAASALASAAAGSGAPPRIRPGEYTPVYVREKVRVETADPKIMSLSAKLNSLRSTIARLEANLCTALENARGKEE